MDTHGRLWELVSGAGPMVKLVLLILLIFSVFSWAIIVYKVLLLRKIERETGLFYDLFWDKRRFAEIHSVTGEFPNTPLTALFNSVYSELSSSRRQPPDAGSDDARAADGPEIERIERILKKAVSKETARLEYAVTFLATTGNTAPFIGLFGTVWGIMNSFRSIGAKGAANLAVVAPGIAEALIATAMGLFAAIPAVMGYNYILARIGRITSDMDNFSTDLINIIEKNLSR
ncbi:MAG: protein TolQ [Thermodesulfobacteriota bacterium]